MHNAGVGDSAIKPLSNPIDRRIILTFLCEEFTQLRAKRDDLLADAIGKRELVSVPTGNSGRRTILRRHPRFHLRDLVELDRATRENEDIADAKRTNK